MKTTVLDTTFFLPNQNFFTQSLSYCETLMHSHTFFEIFFVNSGEVLHLINGQDEIVRQNDLVFLRPHDVHAFKFHNSQNFFHIDVLFTEELFSKVQNFLSSAKLNEFLTAPAPFHTKLTPYDAITFQKNINDINSLPNQDSDKQALILAFLSKLFSLVISDHIDVQNKNDYPFWLTQLLSILNSSDSLKKSKQEIFALLDNFSYNPAYISRIFSRYTGMTITEYINQIRFSTAYSLLVSTDMPIPAILDYIGISSKPYFYREFLKRFHITPIQLRKHQKRT